ncbi:MAG: HAD-IC family P-type ATPase, partial [Deltaproteobacteria bacterium]|nr:HAD-IC family P-type ATPase [Deltaproteobacteria bacterium]
MRPDPFSFHETLSFSGLSEAEARVRLEQEGPNELPLLRRHDFLFLLWEMLCEPMILLLMTAALIYFFLGDLIEAIILMSSLGGVVGITLYQERKSERALEALRDLSSPRALVIRQSKMKRIPGREVVRGDLVVIREGDRVPADAALLSASNLLLDESLLTGESVPVRKSLWDRVSKISSPSGEGIPFVYSGTLVLQGYGIAEVLLTGANTEVGRIGEALKSVNSEKTLLQKEIGRLVRVFALLGLSLCVMVALFYGFSQRSALKGILTGITLAMSMVPEEIPVVLSVFFALGAWRIAKRNVLTRRVSAIEALGAITVLCVDKTGTLTFNRMTLKKLYAHEKIFETSSQKENECFPETFHALLEYAILASQRDPFDPMERSIHEKGNQLLRATEHLHSDWTLVKEYPLSPELLALSHVWQSPEGSDFIIAAKGAPEAMIDLCHLSPLRAEELLRDVQSIAKEGFRVIAVAKARFQKNPLPLIQHDFDFEFLGFLAFEDPIRPTVPQSVQECASAGIRVVMMTGDYPATALKVAQ